MLIERGHFSGADFNAADFDIYRLVDAAGECPETGSFIEAALGRLITQYREAAKLKALVAAYVGQIEEAARATCEMPLYFEIETAIGEPLTMLGKRMGWPRCHCVCVTSPVFGFAYPETVVSPPYDIADLCEVGSTWVGCGEVGQGQICIDDDEIYRLFLKVRRYQMLGLYDIESLNASVQTFWGPQASVFESTPGTIILAPSRNLTSYERTLVPLALRVMPIAPGIRVLMHFGEGSVFGFGEGWGGLCETPEAIWLCPERVDPYACS